jgi:hypothetical protein
MAQAFVMATAKETPDEGPSALWVVLTDSPILAIETARASGYPVDVVVGRLSEETVHQLGIHLVRRSSSESLEGATRASPEIARLGSRVVPRRIRLLWGGPTTPATVGTGHRRPPHPRRMNGRYPSCSR